uniref:Trehalose 6-phosphate phosphatase n=1 Tax=Oryza nivara TaxID=4536 RepID=A0A0E0HQC6_ORYNI
MLRARSWWPPPLLGWPPARHTASCCASCIVRLQEQAREEEIEALSKQGKWLTRRFTNIRFPLVYSTQGHNFVHLGTNQISNEKIQFNYVNIQQQVFDKTVSSVITAVLSKVTNLSTRFAKGKELLIAYNYNVTDTGKRENTGKVMCPSALASFEEITTSAHGKRVALFLDYDGTLSPIVDDHERTFVLP